MNKSFLILSTVAVVLTACSKKAAVVPVQALTPQNATAANLVGTWSATVDTTTYSSNGKNTVTVQQFTDGTRLQFNSDGSGVNTSNTNPPTNFTYTVANGILTLHLTSVSENLPFTIFTISSKTLGLRLTAGSATDDSSYVKN